MPRSDAPPRASPLRRFAAPVLLLALVALVGWGLKELFTGPVKTRPSAQQITLVRPDQPPPPPKPPEKPPDPPKVREEVKLDQPKPQDEPVQRDEPPPAGRLGIEGEGSGDGDGFGLGANRGGRDLVGSAPTIGGGGGSGTARASYLFYRDVVTRHMNDVLSKVPDLREQDLALTIALWIDAHGRIERIDLKNAEMPSEFADRIRSALLAAPPLRQAPPEGMPQPVRVRVRVQEVG